MRVAFSRVGDFHARSRFARSTIPEEKWGTTRSLKVKKYVCILPHFVFTGMFLSFLSFFWISV